MKCIKLIVFLLIVLVIITGCSSVPDLSYAEIVTVYYTEAQAELIVEITGKDDVNDLNRAFTEDNESGSGNCGFTELKLVFEGDDEKTLSLHPTTDGCPTVSYRTNGAHYYFMSNENRKALYDILAEYEIPLDYEYLYSCLDNSE